jgi:hypothetical protein
VTFDVNDRVRITHWDSATGPSKYDGLEGTVLFTYPKIEAYQVGVDNDPDGGGFMMVGLICYEGELEALDAG